MIRFIARRAAAAALLVALASASALLLTRLAPGDLTGDLGPGAEPGQVAALRARYGLDRGPLVQLADWAQRAIRFDFGESYSYNQPVGPLVARAALNTALLAGLALLLATVVGLMLGVVSGSSSGAAAGIIRSASLLCLSMPPLVTSFALVYLAARTGWLPTGGMTSSNARELAGLARAADVAWHLPVPVLALAIPFAARFERLQSAAIREVLHQPFVAAAAARGLSWRAVVLRHAWRVSLVPVLGVYGIAVGALLSGSFVVEYVAGWPGLGRLMYDALQARDIYLVAGCAAWGAGVLAGGVLVGDLLLAAADPRAREALS